MPTDIQLRMIPPTPMVEKDSIPFPRTESQPTVALSAVHALAGPSHPHAESVNDSLLAAAVPPAPQSTPEHSPQASTETTTSGGDHLSSLPQTQAAPSTPRRFNRPSTPSSNTNFRRSLDAVSASLFSLSSSQNRSPRVLQKTSPLIQSSRVCASEGGSPIRGASPRSILSTRGTRLSDPHPTFSPKSLASSRSPSNSRSRATSPLRRLHQWSSNLHRRHHDNPVEEPWVPIDPFKFKHTSFPSFSLPFSFSCPCPCFPSSAQGTWNQDREEGRKEKRGRGILSAWTNIYLIITDTFPRQIYLHLLLRLPAMYFSRVARYLKMRRLVSLMLCV
ncbi:hypothetical protein BDQ17DRAFT_751778 [Cyathus striatus]|nr:hypothetical protein BDQ17DRAFT_751778 [Cyathus striatus]